MNSVAARIRVWDWTIRLFHWTLVVLIVALWRTAETGAMDWHRRLGLITMGLLVFRLYWGVAGPQTARFSSFIKGPRAIFAYLSKLRRRPYAPAFGHNPVGALSVAALLLALLAQIGLGLFAVDVDGLESGPLARYVSFEFGRAAAELHELVFNILVALIALHVAAVVSYLLVLKTNLVRPMMTGQRNAAPEEVALEPVEAPLWKVALGVVLAVSVVALIYVV